MAYQVMDMAINMTLRLLSVIYIAIVLRCDFAHLIRPSLHRNFYPDTFLGIYSYSAEFHTWNQVSENNSKAKSRDVYTPPLVTDLYMFLLHNSRMTTAITAYPVNVSRASTVLLVF